MRRIERRIRKDVDEMDACSKWGRRFFRWINKPGVRSRIKKKIRRRERREGKEELRYESENEL